jgi:hypothetical protein
MGGARGGVSLVPPLEAAGEYRTETKSSCPIFHIASPANYRRNEPNVNVAANVCPGVTSVSYAAIEPF